MIVARAMGVAALDLFEPRPSSLDGHPPLAAEEAGPVFDDVPKPGFLPVLAGDLDARLHRAALVVPVLPVPTAPVRLGSALRAIPGRALAHQLDGTLMARPLA
jgi:hypothetical protein